MSNAVIEQITTIRNPEYPHIVWLEIKSSDGHVGLGETSFSTDAVESLIHGEFSEYLIGKDPYKMDLHWDQLARKIRVIRGRGVDGSAVSAVDMSLWDLFAKKVDQPM
ncbi:MAG: mandelate racemase/muconate lactonizing enzyme family protein, partial [Dehalococcoidia bacterium]|nr:mandelate racemase/muconate lactonizing enzyme family protein [Dehalococcoidia bacterium]